MKELTEKKQKLKKEIRHLKAHMSDKKSVLFDLIKLAYSIDLHSDAVKDLQNPASVSADAAASFTAELNKEAKSSPALQPYAQKVAGKQKELAKLMDNSNQMWEEASKLRLEFYSELENAIRVVETKLKA